MMVVPAPTMRPALQTHSAMLAINLRTNGSARPASLLPALWFITKSPKHQVDRRLVGPQRRVGLCRGEIRSY